MNATILENFCIFLAAQVLAALEYACFFFFFPPVIYHATSTLLVQLIFIISGFQISKFTCFLKFICNLKINPHCAFLGIPRQCRATKHFSSLIDIPFPSWDQTRWHSASLFQLSYLKLMSLSWFFQCSSFHTSVLFAAGLLFKMPPKQSAEMLCC